MLSYRDANIEAPSTLVGLARLKSLSTGSVRRMALVAGALGDSNYQPPAAFNQLLTIPQSDDEKLATVLKGKRS